jgi:hypothetical protein
MAFAQALGVGCAHCHDTRDWASDAKPTKRRARDMMAMVASVNETHFAGKPVIGCATCHRGDVAPARNAGPLVEIDFAMPDGTPPPRAAFFVGPNGFSAAIRADIRQDQERPEGLRSAGGMHAVVGCAITRRPDAAGARLAALGGERLTSEI